MCLRPTLAAKRFGVDTSAAFTFRHCPVLPSTPVIMEFDHINAQLREGT
jgi:hypothetical protein